MGERKYFLDWLRIAAFVLLILFHVGMLYVTWDYNLKAERLFPDLELAMNSLSPWRLVLLFFISGVASRFLLHKLGAGAFARDRSRRLLPVILIGMLLINPVQVYVEFLSKDYVDGSYLEFWLGSYLTAASFPDRIIPTWDHLWFIVYLLFYTLGLALVFRLRGEARSTQVSMTALFLIPACWLAVTNVLVSEVKPVTHALVDDWANHLRWIGVFAAGVICAGQTRFWETLSTRRRWLAGFSLLMFAAQLTNGIYYRTGQMDPFWDGILYGVLGGIYGWSVVLTLCGYAARYLNQPSRILTYLTDAILPIYVFHQPVMLVCAYFVFPQMLPPGVEVALLIAVTALGSLAAYELFARRTRTLRFLFGLKPVPALSNPSL